MRNLGLILTFWLAIIALPTNSLALSLGEIEVNSFLNQPLNAEIPVSSARAGEIDDLLVTLASRDAFKRAGLLRNSHLSFLRFTVGKTGDGDSAVISVTTETPVKEPFLNFLVEADWAKGRLVKEFTILLDPPFYGDTSDLAKAARELTSDTSGLVDDENNGQAISPIAVLDPSAWSGDHIIPLPIAQSDLPESDIDDREQVAVIETDIEMVGDIPAADIQVEKGDTLWDIASRFKDPANSMNQVMLAMQRMNPGAFNDANINNLKVGSILRTPTTEQLNRISVGEAYAEVLDQNGLWENYVAHVTGSSSVPVSNAGGDGAKGGWGSTIKNSLSNLSLLASGDQDSDATGLQGDGENNSKLNRRLALAEEELEAARVDNAELESRIADLEATLSKVLELQNLLKIENESLAQLQADKALANQVAADRAAADRAAADRAAADRAAADKAAADKAAADKAAADKAAADKAAADRAAADRAAADRAAADRAAADKAAADKAAADKAAADKAAADKAAADRAAADKAAADTTVADGAKKKIIEPEVGATPPAAPVVISEPIQQPDSFLDGVFSFLEGIFSTVSLDMLSGVVDMLPSVDGVLANPLLLGGLIGVVVLLLIWVWYKRRQEDTYFDDEDDFDSDPDNVLADNEKDEIDAMHQDLEMSQDNNDAAPSDISDFKVDMTSEDHVSNLTDISAPGGVAGDSGDIEQDDILNEADVYLAYGLYDNAEELLTQSLEANPDRADYRAKLLDTYFATKNSGKFSGQAEKLKSMGSVADGYWGRVQAMGYELAPDNALFSGGKDSDINIVDLEPAKPEAADFDIATDNSSEYMIDDFSDMQSNAEVTTSEDQVDIGAASDFELPDNFEGQEEDKNDDLDNALDFDSTMVMGSDDDPGTASSELDDVVDEDHDFDSTMVLDMDDDFGAAPAELNDEVDEAPDFDNTMVLDMDDDLGAATSGLDAEIDEASDFDSEMVLEMADDLEASSAESEIEDSLDPASEDNIDFGLEDAESDDGAVDLTMSDDDFADSVSSDDDDDFGASSDDDFSFDLDESDMDIDLDDDASKTQTFAPGDFDDPEDADISDTDSDDVGDIVLPDDVDEISTKLDLARAFIDMGDGEGARSRLDQVLAEGDEEQVEEATGLLKHL